MRLGFLQSVIESICGGIDYLNTEPSDPLGFELDADPFKWGRQFI
jgi:hypothetical protein